MRSIRAVAAAAVLSLAATACATMGPPPPSMAVDETLLVRAEQLMPVLDQPRTVVLHVARERSEYEAGHVPGAQFLALRDIVTERDGVPNMLPDVPHLREVFEAAGVSDDSHVVVYGDLDGLSATRAFFTLEYLGHRRVSVLDGGLEHWRAEGWPLATTPPAPRRGTLEPRPRPELVVDADWVREHLGDTLVVLVDARPPAEYRGEEAGAGIPRPGHIPGAANVFWRNHLRAGEDMRLRVPEVLHAMWRMAGARDGRTVVSYCRTGVQASHGYFVARYLGHEARLYDGSFIDWSNRGEAYPVER